MKTHISGAHGRTDERNPCAGLFLPGRCCLIVVTLACFISAQSYSQTSQPPSDSKPKADRSLAFDEDVGFDASWAAEKKLIAFFRAEGFLMVGQPFTNGVANSLFRAAQVSTNGTNITVRWEPLDKGFVRYAYSRAMYPHPAVYRLSATRGTAGCAVLMLIAAKISADRLSAIKEALQEFDSTKKPVVKVNGDFTKRGDFRVTVDQDTVQLENLWKSKGL
jgi:hypothetical protein